MGTQHIALLAARSIVTAAILMTFAMAPAVAQDTSLVKDASFVELFEDFWRAIAKRYANTNPDMVFFEILNEPEFRDRMEALIGQAAAWAKRWNVPLTCNEFGVYRRTAGPQARAPWLSDLHSVLEKYDIGWTMWDYSGGFAVVVKTKDQPAAPDEITIKALGLKVPPPFASTVTPGTAKP